MIDMNAEDQAVERVYYESRDGLLITGDLYSADKPKGYLLLCHRSHYNRGEYCEIAPKLAALGFLCLAVDQRSGMNVLGFTNETSTLAKQKGLPTGYLDAKQDIEASIDYLYERNGHKPIILVGSSYSASLALLIAKDNAKVKAVAAFSPGEYLKKTKVAESIKGLAKPTYVTSARKETADVGQIIRYMDMKYATYFRSQDAGFHGARTLWDTVDGHEKYWESFSQFLLINSDTQ